MFWHGGFPLLVIGYGLLKDRKAHQPQRASALIAVNSHRVSSCSSLTWSPPRRAVAAADHVRPTLYASDDRRRVDGVGAQLRGAGRVVVGVVPHSVLDVWLMLVMVAWLFDIALAAVLNGGRFDLGFYAGRIYGLAAATFVLIVLLLETGHSMRRLARRSTSSTSAMRPRSPASMPG